LERNVPDQTDIDIITEGSRKPKITSSI